MASRTYFSSTSNLMQCNCVKKGSSNQCVFHSNGKSIHVAGSTSVVGGYQRLLLQGLAYDGGITVVIKSSV